MKTKIFGKGKETINKKEWDWGNFATTEGYPVSDNLLDWLIGQDEALTECHLCLDEWLTKLQYLNKKEWWKDFEKPEGMKRQPKDILPAGPFLFLIGDAGTGKSLLGRAMSSYLTELYEQHHIELHDVMSWFNKELPSEPRISIHKTGEGRKILKAEETKVKKHGNKLKKAIKLLIGGLVGVGGVLTALTCYSIYKATLVFQAAFDLPLFDALVASIQSNMYNLVVPLSLLGTGVMLFFFANFLGNQLGGAMQGIGGAKQTIAPKLIVDNSSGKVPFVDATGHGSAQLFGSIAWDPYQTGGLSTPEHQRVSAGDVHRAHLGILYIDEIKNLTGAEAITLLTVLEDGQLPIALRSQFHGGDTAAMSVSTEPVPCMNFLVVAGNLDSLTLIHPALLDRIQGYGKIVYMNNDMPNTVKNRRKCVQFIAQEAKRFNLLPFSRDACAEIVDEFRRKSDRKDKLVTKFRPMISIIKTASVLANNEGLNVVERKHVVEARETHCKPIGLQLLEKHVDRISEYRIIDPNAKPQKGQIYGLVVYSDQWVEGEAGGVIPIKASVTPTIKGKESLTVTGVNMDAGSWAQNSRLKVLTVIHQLYPKTQTKAYNMHIDFAQFNEVDGPSAGVAMALVLVSLFENKSLRQDTAVTGEINIGVDGKVTITPIGGVYEKIAAAEKCGFKRILIPTKNYELNVNSKDFKIEIIPCETLDDYKKNILVDD